MLLSLRDRRERHGTAPRRKLVERLVASTALGLALLACGDSFTSGSGAGAGGAPVTHSATAGGGGATTTTTTGSGGSGGASTTTTTPTGSGGASTTTTTPTGSGGHGGGVGWCAGQSQKGLVLCEDFDGWDDLNQLMAKKDWQPYGNGPSASLGLSQQIQNTPSLPNALFAKAASGGSSAIVHDILIGPNKGTIRLEFDLRVVSSGLAGNQYANLVGVLFGHVPADGILYVTLHAGGLEFAWYADSLDGGAPPVITLANPAPASWTHVTLDMQPKFGVASASLDGNVPLVLPFGSGASIAAGSVRVVAGIFGTDPSAGEVDVAMDDLTVVTGP